ncbi:tRNA 5-methylaminomethyl-2-thiouridine biosynthesis bifunctional protein MnmC [Labeo rohita]|uniref:tRNA 5-methylaminomethyl-2-thiouridine biosynthesis bifunctional protein MnmC n=1 Tax=Labeo rohita TaxID=84645 RepID=A0ABQ8LM65_LABRO|nr:tRNA 5-methylaminomethyl-2-thiouridine biosynthesis bifunctional protein MnmC [Labeo rohita]
MVTNDLLLGADTALYSILILLDLSWTILPCASSTNNRSSSLSVLSNNGRKETLNLGVIFDLELSFNAQMTEVLQSCFVQLRQLMEIKSFLPFADLEKVTHAFISSKLDYCNALYSGISRRNIQRLQLLPGF